MSKFGKVIQGMGDAARIAGIPGKIVGGVVNTGLDKLRGGRPTSKSMKQDQGTGIRSSAAQNALSNKGYDTRDQMRLEELGLLGDQVSLDEQGIQDFIGRQDDDRALRKFTAGRALSNMMPGSSLNSSGAWLQAVNQGSMDVAAAEMQQRQQADRELRGLRDQAAERKVGLVRRRGELGTRETDKGPAYAKAQGMIQNAITENSNVWGGLRGDNTKQMFIEASTIINQIRQESPDAADALVAEYLTPGGKGYTQIRNLEGIDQNLGPAAYAGTATV